MVMTTKRWIVGSSVLVLALVITIGLLVHGCSSSDKPATTAATTTVTKATVAIPDQTAILQKRIDVLQTQYEALKKQAAEEKAQKVQVVQVQTPADKPNAAVQQILTHVGDSADMSLQMRTGRPAVIHELEQAALREKQQNRQRVEVTQSAPRYTRFDLEQAEEKEAQAKDVIKDLHNKIRNAGESLADMQKYADEQPHLDIRKWARKRVTEIKEDIANMNGKLPQAETSLRAATAETARIGRNVR